MHTQAFVPEPVADVRHFEQAGSAHAPASVLPVAATVAMPSAEMLQALASHGSGVATNASDVGHILTDALSGGGAHADIDGLLEFVVGHEATHAELAAGHFTAGFASHDLAVFAGAAHVHAFLGVEMLEAHQAAAPAA
jgi:hypothetical protein